MERTFESIVDELKARVNSIKKERSTHRSDIYYNELSVINIENLLDDFNQNLDDLKDKYSELNLVLLDKLSE